MADQTTFLDLVKPAGGEPVQIRVINENMDKVDDFAKGVGSPLVRTRDFKGPAADRASVVPNPQYGDTYLETDVNKAFLRYDGTNWVGAEGGMYLIRPTTVVGATVDATGAIIPTHAANANASPVQVTDVFTSRFRSYLIEYSMTFSGPANTSMLARNGTTDLTSNAYTNQVMQANNTTVAATQGTLTRMPLSAYPATAHLGSINIKNTHATNHLKAITCDDLTNAVGISSRGGYIASNGFIMTGFALTAMESVNWVSNDGQSWLKIYGLA